MIDAFSLRLMIRNRRMFGPIVFLARSAAMWLASDELPPLPTVNTCLPLR